MSILAYRRWLAVSEAFEKPGMFSSTPVDWYNAEGNAMAEDGVPTNDILAIEWLGAAAADRDDTEIEANVPPSVAKWLEANAVVLAEEAE